MVQNKYGTSVVSETKNFLSFPISLPIPMCSCLNVSCHPGFCHHCHIPAREKGERERRDNTLSFQGVTTLDREDLLEKEMVSHSSILAWKIPWTEEPGGVESMRWQKSDTTDHWAQLVAPYFIYTHFPLTRPTGIAKTSFRESWRRQFLVEQPRSKINFFLLPKKIRRIILILTIASTQCKGN